jgi:hypothetical protein
MIILLSVSFRTLVFIKVVNNRPDRADIAAFLGVPET